MTWTGYRLNACAVHAISGKRARLALVKPAPRLAARFGERETNMRSRPSALPGKRNRDDDGRTPAREAQRSPPPMTSLLLRRAFAACVIGLHFGATEDAVVIRVRFLHDFVHDTLRALIGDRFLQRHDLIVVCVALLEIRAPVWITADPFLQSHTAVMIRIARNENFNDNKIARFVAGQISVVIRVGLAKGVGSGGGSSLWCRRDSIRRKRKEGDSREKKEDASRAARLTTDDSIR